VVVGSAEVGTAGSAEVGTAGSAEVTGRTAWPVGSATEVTGRWTVRTTWTAGTTEVAGRRTAGTTEVAGWRTAGTTEVAGWRTAGRRTTWTAGPALRRRPARTTGATLSLWGRYAWCGVGNA
jgi:hypothetical protein